MAVYKVTLEGREYRVRIESVDTQPVQVEVDGREMQVWLPDRPPTAAPGGTEVQPPRTNSTPLCLVPLSAWVSKRVIG